MFNPQKSLWPESKFYFCHSFCGRHQRVSPNLYFILASTSTLKLPLSPRPNLIPFPSRETASATKCHQHFWCLQLWPSPKINHTLLSHLAGYAFWLLYCTFILATNCFKKLKRNSNLRFYCKITYVLSLTASDSLVIGKKCWLKFKSFFKCKANNEWLHKRSIRFHTCHNILCRSDK